MYRSDRHRVRYRGNQDTSDFWCELGRTNSGQTPHNAVAPVHERERIGEQAVMLLCSIASQTTRVESCGPQ